MTTKAAARIDFSKDRMIDLATAADLLGVTTKTIRRMIAAGSIRGYRVGPRIVRVSRNELEDYLSPIPTTGGHE